MLWVARAIKSFGNRNVSKNVNDNSSGDFLSSHLDSITKQQKKKAKLRLVAAGRALPVPAVQEEDQQAADEIQAPAKAGERDESFFEVSAPQQEKSLDDFLTVVPVSQLKFFQAFWLPELRNSRPHHQPQTSKPLPHLSQNAQQEKPVSIELCFYLNDAMNTTAILRHIHFVSNNLPYLNLPEKQTAVM